LVVKRRLKTIDAAPPEHAANRSDRDYLALALALAARGLGNVWPNPAVGCVVERDGIVVGRGWTQPGGRPHAETMALQQAGNRAAGATAYVSLEPCAHHGQTPPCAEALIAAGIARVVIAAPDPDTRVDGRGAEMLHAAGLQVDWADAGIAAAAEALNAGFLSKVNRNRPLVTLKLASTLDGRIATAGGESQWITGPEARARGHLMRAEHDAILVGIGTALADDPELTCRLPGLAARSPVRVVLDSRLRLPEGGRLARGAGAHPLWLLTGPGQNSQALQDRGAEILPLPLGADGGIDLAAAMTCLAGRGITRLLVEGGSAVTTAFLSAGLVDNLAWFRAPGVIGGDGLPVFGDLDLTALANMPRFKSETIESLGDDVLESYVHQA
jgi:diaminohydroxyphosphoribosylaminopyrimidine deaminase/5-amino-6-(5-phosphoribosylamino)uracil reductase